MQDRTRLFRIVFHPQTGNSIIMLDEGRIVEQGTTPNRTSKQGAWLRTVMKSNWTPRKRNLREDKGKH
jgi:hypothetical protein